MVLVRWMIWSAENVAHIARHNVTTDEVEEACQGDYNERETYGNRLLLIGKTHAGRILAVVLSPTTTDAYCVVTARDADRKERHIYQQEHEEGGEQAA